MISNSGIYSKGLITAKPDDEILKTGNTPGVHLFRSSTHNRNSLFYIPERYKPTRASSLAVMLHGAGRDPAHGLSLLKDYADKHNIILFAPASKEYTWDLIASFYFGPDVASLNKGLEYIFGHYYIDTTRIAIVGFSDGASYALSLGLNNGNLFTHIVAFSPGFIYTEEISGKPDLFISHGTKDPVLPVNSCSRRIIKQLSSSGYCPQCLIFEGGHEVPADVSKAAVNWFTDDDLAASNSFITNI